MFNVSTKRSLSFDRTGGDEMPSTKESRKSGNVLQGMVICLTGLPIDQKKRLHRLVEMLGGRYTGDLDTSQTTHLISQTSKGAKYETASACSRIFIVTPIWLIDTFKAGKRMTEADYPVASDGETTFSHSDQPLEYDLDKILERPERKVVFSPCRFLLIGFEGRSGEGRKLEKLIQRGRGILYREMNEIISHLIVRDECDKVLLDASKTVSVHHPCQPPVLSPQWVLKSFEAEKLLTTASSEYRPRDPVVVQSCLPKSGAAETENRTLTKVKDKTSRLLRSSIFYLVRLSPPSGAVDFSTSQLKDEIVNNGGRILSSKVLEALRVDQQTSSNSRRICYVVCWGGFTSTHLSIHNLLSQLQKEDLSQIVPVTPIWLKTSIKEGKLLGISRNPVLFQPQSWPFMKLPKKLKIAVTGFVGSERTALIQIIRAMGADYTESMKPNNTHLICREGKGEKYEKGLEWGLGVVSIDWLYHILQHGYGGLNKADEEGCEDRFSLSKEVSSTSETESKNNETK